MQKFSRRNGKTRSRREKASKNGSTVLICVLKCTWCLWFQSIHRFYEPSLLALADHFHTIRSVSKDKMAMGKIEIKRFTLSELLQFNRSQLHSYLHVYIQSMLKQNSCVRNKTDIIYVKGFRFNQSTHFLLCINYD